nr:unnamed protein product [Callosobruchus analis]
MRRLKRSEVYAEESSAKVRVIKWVDQRPVMMITSDPSHDANVIDSGKKNRKGDAVKKPKCVLDYIKAKKGVDISDQMSSYFSVLRKSLKKGQLLNANYTRLPDRKVKEENAEKDVLDVIRS